MKIEMIARKQTEFFNRSKNGNSDQYNVTFLTSLGERVNFEIANYQMQNFVKKAPYGDDIKISIEIEDEKLI